MPQARVVMLTRHPVDVYSSYKRRLEKERDLGDRDFQWLDVAPDEFAEGYVRDTNAIKQAGRVYRDRTFLLRYEDFVSSPEQEFRKVCSFVDTSFESDPIKGRCEALDSWAPDPHLARPITEDTKDWRDYIPEREASQIETHLQSILKDFEYEPYTQ
ncbi:hypothetical protein GGQ12_002604 [Salinibacter ruber]|nr:hypothetical protein [Salinibacter ruber]